jgi:hypothetical protein
MTATQYREALSALGLTQARAAGYLGLCVRTSNGYANGWPIPRTVELLLNRLLRDNEEDVNAP